MAFSTPNFLEAVNKAQLRANQIGVDFESLSDRIREGFPEYFASEAEKRERKRFLEGLYDTDREADAAFERIIGGNELQHASFLSRGALVSRCVARVVIRDGSGRVLGYGTGSLIGDGVLMTNNHVLKDAGAAEASEIELFYERGLLGEDRSPLRFRLEPQHLFYTSEALDFTVVAVAEEAIGGDGSLAGIGWLPLIAQTGKVVEGEWLTIIQHPKGERKQLCVRENQLLKRETDVLWYSTDTLGGSSGSPVFNNDWLIVALHHSGIPEIKNGKWQTVDGRDYDRARDAEDKIKWIANEGIRISRIIETLRTDNGISSHRRVVPMLDVGVQDIAYRLPVMFRDGKVPRQILELDAMSGEHTNRPAAGAVDPGISGTRNPAGGKDMSQRLIHLTIAVDEDGNARIVESGAGGAESVLLEGNKSEKPLIDAPVEEDKDWGTGFEPGFLDPNQPGLVVHLPKLSAANRKSVAKLKVAPVYGKPAPTQAQADAGVLDYWHYSVVMNAKRRLAFFSAANIEWGGRYGLDRSGDKWLWDDRIDRAHQVGNSFYVSNKFDRGHLTRREDLEWGPNPIDATRKANGTCTWTNCVPQHELFNQDKNFPGKTAALWGGLEKYILERTALYHQFRVQSFTGPIFGDDDPVYRDLKIPLSFWKVVVAVSSSGKLFATGYVLSQNFLVDRDWGRLDEAALEQPFGRFETYQTKISEIEAETGLSFTCGASAAALSLFDPLAKPNWRRSASRGAAARESFGAGTRGPDAPLESFADLILE